jgi:hypothetical protein
MQWARIRTSVGIFLPEVNNFWGFSPGERYPVVFCSATFTAYLNSQTISVRAKAYL